MFLYWLTRLLVKVWAKLFFHLRVEGLANLPKQGGFILAANHASSLDPFLISAVIPRYIRWTVIYEYYDLWHLKWVLRHLRFIRIKNNLPKAVFYALGQREVIGIFPEGRRCENGELGPAKPGVASLARRTHSPVVPLAILGTFTALPRTRKSLKFCPIVVRIGAPLCFSSFENSQANAGKDQEHIQQIMQAIAALLRQ